MAIVRKCRQERGFTLIELLVVMGIMSVLAGMVIGGVHHALVRARKARAQANLSTLSLALDQYTTATGRLPAGDVPGPARDDPWALFAGLMTGRPALGGATHVLVEDWPTDAIGKWRGDFDDVYERATDDDLDFAHGAQAKAVFLDPWGHAYHYVELESRAPDERARFPRAGQRFALWSDGPDGVDDHGGGDDVASWRAE